MPRFEFITFDCYGTLIDWRSGIREAFNRAMQREGVAIDGEKALHAYHVIEPKVETESYRPYRDVLTETATRVAHSCGWPIPYERAHFLADSLPSWKPFDDTNEALEMLRDGGCRLGLLSNIDDDLIAATRKHFTVDFDLAITAQQLRSYKPGAAHFIAARDRLRDIRWLHAAQSNFHDILPTNILGIPNAWINRLGEAPLQGGVPGAEFRDLRSFAEWMTH